MASKKRIYLGIAPFNAKREIFESYRTPTERSHGTKFAAVIGPFKTLKGAEFMRDYGNANPHCQHVDDAERLALLP